MKFSLVNGIKQEPSPKLKGVCCHCESATQAKCGTQKVWHWAHVNLENCDPWWESETDWHRLWKGYFPSQNQEIIHFDDETGEKHIADIKTDNGMVIEVQNSPMNELEMLSREHFYGKMMWILNGKKFKNSFAILEKLPDPKSEVAQEVYFTQPTSRSYDFKSWDMKNRWKGKLNDEKEGRIIHRMDFFIRSDNPQFEEQYEKWLKAGRKGVVFLCRRSDDMHERDRIAKDIQSNYVGHHLFVWKNPRDVWFQSEKPIFIDFGGNELWRLMDYGFMGLKCVRKISKQVLVEKNGGCYVSVPDEDS